MMKSKQIYYYKDELNDEFSGAEITPRIIDENYKYIHRNPLWDFCSFLLQNVISMPIKFYLFALFYLFLFLFLVLARLEMVLEAGLV